MRRHAPRLHKEQIIETLWPDRDPDEGDRDFKVALHTLHKVLEPTRPPRTDPRFVQRYDLTYGLNPDGCVVVDSDIFEQLVAAGNAALPNDVELATRLYEEARDLYQGDYLPERRYEDWSSPERERLQVLALGMLTSLATLLVNQNPLESLRLTQHVLAMEPVWEEAYRIQMKAYMAQGNRPLALKAYQQCVETLQAELGIPPLPETQALHEQIRTQA